MKGNKVPVTISLMIPNLTKLNLSNTKFQYSEIVMKLFFENCAFLQSLTWHGSRCQFPASGNGLQKATSLKELYMDDGKFYFRDQNKSYDFRTIFWGGTDYKPHLRLFCLFPAKLERVSIRNATMKYLFLYDRATPLSFQHREKLIRSLSSDLSWFQGED